MTDSSTPDGDTESAAAEPPDGEDTTTESRDTDDLTAFSDLARAAYCPRQLYYARRDERTVPETVTRVTALADRYRELRDADDATLATTPVAVEPATYRERLRTLAERPVWDALVAPAARETYLVGKDCHGVASKVLAGATLAAAGDDGATPDDDQTPVDDEPTTDGTPPPAPVFVSPGEPHETGVWEPHAVRAVAAAKALAWEREREIPRAFVEYPAYAVVREVRLGVRRTAAYRRALRTARGIDGPPPRLGGSPKCDPCPYREECGVATNSLRSLLGL
ncbi:hypothetical protein RYH80_14095 [Halobaculum sp. MBLA0147]|uniref:CRISPR-associated protein Cas4 n=1 Tax=Halobaculum sp. MBLA0147 TaxID=3079934 RepID=UPI0035236163